MNLFFWTSKREETILKRDVKTMTQNIQKRCTPFPNWDKKQLSKVEKQKSHPYQDPTQSMKPTKVKGPFFTKQFRL